MRRCAIFPTRAHTMRCERLRLYAALVSASMQQKPLVFCVRWCDDRNA